MEVTRKQNTPNFPKNEHFLPPDTHMYVCVSVGKKCSFFGKFGILCFLVTSVLKFAFLAYYGRISLLSFATKYLRIQKIYSKMYSTLFDNTTFEVDEMV